MTPTETSTERHLHLSTDPTLRRRFTVIDEDVKANIRVGVLLEVLDTLAEDTALHYAQRAHPAARVVTASIDDLRVYNPPDIERDLVLQARINFIGKTSMEVGIRITQPGNPEAHIGSCFFTMVARVTRGDVDVSAALPDLEYATDEDFERRTRASRRREAHKKSTANDHPTAEEYALLRSLHERLELGASVRGLGSLVTSGWERTYPEHENVPQKIFGGFVAHRAYMYAHICAEMLCEQRPLLVTSERIDFYQPVRMGDKLHFVSRITYTGQTSLRVETAITRISRDRTVTALSNTCAFTFVHVDANLKRQPIPPVYPSNYLEDERYLVGRRSHERYLASKSTPRLKGQDSLTSLVSCR